jgi:type I restriction enzyme S subunit
VRFFPNTVDAHYLTIALNSRLVRDQIEGPIRSAVGLKNVNSTEFGNLLLPFPPLNEQRRIIHKIEELTKICEKLLSSIESGVTVRRKLLESTLEQALAFAAVRPEHNGNALI